MNTTSAASSAKKNKSHDEMYHAPLLPWNSGEIVVLSDSDILIM